MNLEGKNIGFCLTGSFCTFKNTLIQMKKLVEAGANIIPIMSFNAYDLNTKFGDAEDFKKQIKQITGKEILHTIQEVEPIGPKQMTDVMIIAPCSGNTIGKLSNGITDTPVVMATKSHLRNSNPVVIAVSTNDGLSASAANIGTLLNRNNYYFVPFRQDNPITKPRSLVFDPEKIISTIEYALDKEQIQPILI